MTAERYRAEFIAEGMWVCVRGNDYLRAPIFSSKADAQERAEKMNAIAGAC